MRPQINTASVSRARMTRVLRVLVTVSTVVVSTAVVGVAVATQAPRHRPPAPAVKTVPPASPGTYKGQAFDACTAPSGAEMKAWGKSPYRGIVVYFGGSNRGCKQPNLTAAWVTAQRAAGWHLIPIYVGPQPSCTTGKNKKNLISHSTPVTQGWEIATNAVAAAKKLGMGPDSVLIYDLEPYRSADAACTAATLTFLSAWTVRLHDLGYLSGLYSGMTSGTPDVVAAYDKPGFVRPDYLDFARWDGVQTLTDPAIPDAYWQPRRRMKQYRGPHKETWGGVTINIDSNYLDLAPLPRTRAGDFSGNGWSDLLTLQPATGVLEIHPGNGTTLSRRQLATGWKNLDALTRLGDFNRDGREDVIAREKSTGDLWLYPGTGSGFGARIRIGTTGWNEMSEITAAGDVTGDGHADVLAVHTGTGTLRLYPGRGTSLGRGVDLPAARGELDELVGVGDVDRDGKGDLVARVKSTGVLRLYPGRADGLGAPREISQAGGSLRSLVGVGDFDRDGTADLVAVESATGIWYRYPVTPQGLGARTRIGADATGLLLS